MKLRLSGNSLRLRLTPEEVASLAGGGEIRMETDFGESGRLGYGLRTSTSALAISARLTDNGVSVEVPFGIARDWAYSAEVGLSGAAAGVTNPDREGF